MSGDCAKCFSCIIFLFTVEGAAIIPILHTRKLRLKEAGGFQGTNYDWGS